MPRTSLETLADSLMRMDEPVPEPAVHTPISTVGLRRILTRLHKHRMQGVHMMTPLPHIEPFHACSAVWRILDGSNRSSKSQSAALEASRCFLGVDPHDKYVRRDGNALIVAKDGDDLGRIWRTLTESSFKMIRDERTRLWRAVRFDPNDPLHLDPYDVAYQETWKDAPPLIPKHMIVGGKPAWDDSAKGIPRYATFTTGWKALFRSSKGDPPQGDHYHFGWIDEQLMNELFYTELLRGITQISEPDQHKPKAIWSATSQTVNPQLLDLREKSDADSKHVRAFKTTISQNPYFSDEATEAFFNGLSEDERQVRFYGEYAIASLRVYKRFEPNGVHGCEPFEVPPEFCRYVVLDPGHQSLGSIFFAVDPKEQHAYVYDAFILSGKESSAQSWAHEVKLRQGDMRFEAFSIDQQAGQGHGMGAKVTIAQYYADALEEIDVQPRLRGPMHGFYLSCNHIETRTQALLAWMAIRGAKAFKGTAKLQIMKGTHPTLDKQIARAHADPKNPRKRAKNRRIPDDLLDCLEYAAAWDPPYVEPEPLDKPEEHNVADLLQAKLKRQDARRRQQCVARI